MKNAANKQIKPAIYEPAKIEKKWQKKWASSKLYKSKENAKKPKYYVLDMFPYPSGEGLHVGHPKGYIATDIISRFRRMNGFEVLHPMGFDAFGLPAENYALKTKTHPEIAVKKNVARYKKQLEILGFDYDWSREVNTTDPAYYKWTQWIFLQLLKKGLAYESNEPINWCPVDKTGLANEDIENGRCERCGSLVEKKVLRQWVLKITDYADRLLSDLDAHDARGMTHIIDKKWPPRPGKKAVERRTIHALVKDPKTGKYLGLKWKKFPWITFIVGGVEEGEDIIKAAQREVAEETGYKNIKFVRFLGKPVKAEYFAAHKDQNRIAITTGVLFELESEERSEIEQHEKDAHETIWMDPNDMNAEVMTCAELPVWLDELKKDSNPNDSAAVKPLLDWPESIKELQRNWIGRSEGALLDFKLKGKGLNSLASVFTTRPDTVFGVTYIVLAPEHKQVKDMLSIVENRAEVEAYIARSATQSEIERTDTTKEKTGVELKGIKAVNPANKAEVPVWISDYVLADYGTGAVMAVPAHDDRDYAFAQKFNLPIVEVIVPVDGAPHAGEEFRKTVSAIAYRKSDGKFLALKWKKFGWLSIPIGGVEDGEKPEEAILREVLEETGYKAKLIRALGGPVESHFFAENKNIWRGRLDQSYLLEIEDEKAGPVALEERDKHEALWMDGQELLSSITHRYNAFGLERHLNKKYSYIGKGNLINSGKYDGRDSETVKKELTTAIGGKWVAKYKLRDWVFSRQRYWGEPIPVIRCSKCGIVPVPEKDLPVKLPKVKSYEPTGTGESPLAAIDKWVNVKCPTCKGPAKRETNTMPQWAGSSWYYLRYMDPKNKKEAVALSREKYWSPVDLYVGGAEHATRHLIYARFWHKFLHDIGAVSTTEPFVKLQHVGLIMGEDGRKMSKRFGNVINPDSIVETYGADTLRVYEMFMGPFDQQITWNTASMVGSRRFIEKVWKFRDTLGEHNDALDRIIHKTIKKITEDVGALRFNTAVSSLMILANECERAGTMGKDQYEIILRLLAPLAPHMTEEIWASLGNKKSIHISAWPAFDPALAKDNESKIMVQVNGRVRGSLIALQDISREELERLALELPEAKKWIENAKVAKVIVVPNRLVNIVLA